MGAGDQTQVPRTSSKHSTGEPSLQSHHLQFNGTKTWMPYQREGIYDPYFRSNLNANHNKIYNIKSFQI